jgi:hypothetical protein
MRTLAFGAGGSAVAPALRIRLSRVPGARRTKLSRTVSVKSDGSRTARSMSQSGCPVLAFTRGISTARAPVRAASAMAASIRSLSEPEEKLFGVTAACAIQTAPVAIASHTHLVLI